MTPLQTRALARVALSYPAVESFYDGSHSGTERECLKALCVSHERLRAEVEGLEILRVEDQQRLQRLQQEIDEKWRALEDAAAIRQGLEEEIEEVKAQVAGLEAALEDR